MNDDQLTTELHRRAQARPVPDLLPAVRAAIDTRPQPGITSRLAPLAGVVGIAAALVLLVIALPRLGLGPSASDSVTVPSPAPSAVADGATPIVAADAITCSGEGTEVSLPVVTFQDATGLVESCSHVEPSGAGADATGAPSVVNPDGDSTVLQIEWSGRIGCTSAASFDFTTATTGYTLEGTLHGFEVCRLALVIHAIRVELGAEVPAEQVVAADLVRITEPNPTPRTEVGSAWWELAAHERPTADSTELDLVVYELACANGENPAGRVVGPEIEYAEGAVTITYYVTPLPGGGDCPMAPGVPVTAHLSEPLGDRRIVDGGVAADAVIEASDSLLALETSRVDELAHERFEAMVGGQQCTSTVVYDRYVPTQAELEAAAEIPELLDAGEGFIEFGGYVSDSWLSAARAFGAIEAYGGRPKPWYIVMPGEQLRLAVLDPFPISGGRTVWFAGLYQEVLGDPQCTNRTQTQPPAVPESIPCPSADGRPAEISIIDHSGLVSGCAAFVGPASPEEFVSATNVGSDESTLEVRWEISEICSSMPVQLQLWGPFAYEFSGGLPDYVLQVDERATEGSVGCLDVVADLGVRLTLRSSVSAQQIEVFRTSGTRGLDQGRVGEHTLTVELAPDTLEFAAGEPIDISASIVYSGPRSEVTLTGFDPNPGFGFQQLDGRVRQGPVTDWNCESVELERDVPLLVPFRKGGFFTTGDLSEQSAQAQAYLSDPVLRLPPGQYRFFVRVGGSLDGSCRVVAGEGRAVGARASVIVTVR